MMEKWVSIGSGHKKQWAQQTAPELEATVPRAEMESWKRSVSCQTWGRNVTEREVAHTCDRGCSAHPSWGPAHPALNPAAASLWLNTQEQFFCRPRANGVCVSGHCAAKGSEIKVVNLCSSNTVLCGFDINSLIENWWWGERFHTATE